MGLLGTIILIFLIIQLKDFWYEVQFGHLPLDKNGQEDLYSLVVAVYRNGIASRKDRGPATRKAHGCTDG
jgi:hypothetical protein